MPLLALPEGGRDKALPLTREFGLVVLILAWSFGRDFPDHRPVT